MGTKWSKLLINNAFSGLSAALNVEYGVVLDLDISVVSAVRVADETIRNELKHFSTPYNDMVVRLVKQAEEFQTVPDFETNIKFFEELNNNR